MVLAIVAIVGIMGLIVPGLYVGLAIIASLLVSLFGLIYAIIAPRLNKQNEPNNH